MHEIWLLVHEMLKMLTDHEMSGIPLQHFTCPMKPFSSHLLHPRENGNPGCSIAAIDSATLSALGANIVDIVFSHCSIKQVRIIKLINFIIFFRSVENAYN